jgi:hypothetical protein
MELKDITVLIPSIGRSTIIDSINSVPKECQIHILLDISRSNSQYLWEDFNQLIEPVRRDNIHLATTYVASPGLSKQKLIDSVNTKYFIILDDDDYFHKDFLEYCVKLINNSDESIGWITTHWVTDTEAPNYGILGRLYATVNNDYLHEFYWEWVDGLREHDYTRTHIYPSTETLINADLFHKFQQFNEIDESQFKFRILDDAIPVLNFMLHTTGINHEGFGIFYHQTADSVSRTKLNKNLEADVETVIGVMTRLYLKTRDKIWLKSINNALRTCDFNFNFNE